VRRRRARAVVAPSLAQSKAKVVEVDNYVATMGVTRLINGCLNIALALLMFKYNTPGSALRLNGILGSVGPFVFIFVSAVGMAGLASKIPYPKLALIGLGVLLIIAGTRSV